MIVKAYSIRDSKSEMFSPPFFAQTNGLALRMFTDIANDEKTSICKYPDDFTLFEIGTFDDVKGELMPLKQVISLGIASNYKR